MSARTSSATRPAAAASKLTTPVAGLRLRDSAIGKAAVVSGIAVGAWLFGALTPTAANAATTNPLGVPIDPAASWAPLSADTSTGAGGGTPGYQPGVGMAQNQAVPLGAHALPVGVTNGADAIGQPAAGGVMVPLVPGTPADGISPNQPGPNQPGPNQPQPGDPLDGAALIGLTDRLTRNTDPNGMASGTSGIAQPTTIYCPLDTGSSSVANPCPPIPTAPVDNPVPPGPPVVVPTPPVANPLPPGPPVVVPAPPVASPVPQVPSAPPVNITVSIPGEDSACLLNGLQQLAPPLAWQQIAQVIDACGGQPAGPPAPPVTTPLPPAPPVVVPAPPVTNPLPPAPPVANPAPPVQLPAPPVLPVDNPVPPVANPAPPVNITVSIPGDNGAGLLSWLQQLLPPSLWQQIEQAVSSSIGQAGGPPLPTTTGAGGISAGGVGGAGAISTGADGIGASGLGSTNTGGNGAGAISASGADNTGAGGNGPVSTPVGG